MERDEVVETLNDLIENCKDGEYGFRTCAEHAKSPNLKTVFSQRANDCRSAARRAAIAGDAFRRQAGYRRFRLRCDAPWLGRGAGSGCP